MIAKLIASTLLVVSLLGCVSTPQLSGIPQEVVEWSRSNVYTVRINESKVGSAWWIDKDYAMTACHVVSDMQPNTEVVLRNWDWTRFAELKVVSCDEETDLAMLKRVYPWYEEPELKETTVKKGTPQVGALVYGAGFPSVFPLLIHKGYWGGSDLTEHEDNTSARHIVIVDTAPGDSGSPVIEYSEQGVKVVGIRQSIGLISSWRSSSFMHYITFITASPTIERHIDSYAENYTANLP